MASWALDIFLGHEIEQTVTVGDIEALSGQLARFQSPRASAPRSTRGRSVTKNVR
jgi:hypothetical protein